MGDYDDGSSAAAAVAAAATDGCDCGSRTAVDDAVDVGGSQGVAAAAASARLEEADGPPWPRG